MLKEIKGNRISVECVSCGIITPHDVTDVEVVFMDELNEYQNFRVDCPCGTAEIFNLNIPIDAEDEEFKSGVLPLKEEIQRYYVRILQRLIRPDLNRKQNPVEGGDTTNGTQ